jgi:hypothetical protein
MEGEQFARIRRITPRTLILNLKTEIGPEANVCKVSRQLASQGATSSMQGREARRYTSDSYIKGRTDGPLL